MGRAVGIALLAAFVALLAVASVVAPHDIHAVDLFSRHAAPSADHWLGTDHLGRDVFARLAHGGWNALLATLIAAIVSFGGGIALGLAAAFAGPGLQFLGLRIADLTIILPQIVIAALAVAVAGFSPWSVGIALGIGGIGAYAGMAHGLASAVLRERFVFAAHAMGTRHREIARRHVLPVVLPQLLTYFAAQGGETVIHYAALAFLGLGADTGQPDWGAMLFEYRFYIFEDPWLVLWPATAIFVFVTGLNLSFEPRTRREMRAQAPQPALKTGAEGVAAE